jgi:hypothetical protein
VLEEQFESEARVAALAKGLIPENEQNKEISPRECKKLLFQAGYTSTSLNYKTSLQTALVEYIRKIKTQLKDDSMSESELWVEIYNDEVEEKQNLVLVEDMLVSIGMGKKMIENDYKKRVEKQIRN